MCGFVMPLALSFYVLIYLAVVAVIGWLLELLVLVPTVLRSLILLELDG